MFILRSSVENPCSPVQGDRSVNGITQIFPDLLMIFKWGKICWEESAGENLQSKNYGGKATGETTGEKLQEKN